MSGNQGLIVAGLMGVVAFALNWVYLDSKLRDAEMISFVGIADGVEIAPGEQLSEADLVAVRIPLRHGMRLRNSVFLYEERNTIVGIQATREYREGDLIFRQDYRTPPPRLELAADEVLFWVPVGQAFVPEIVDPGDQVSFRFPGDSQSGVDVEFIGPFRVGTLGNRLGSREVMRAQNLSPTKENILGIIVHEEGGPGNYEPRAMRLIERLQMTDAGGMQVILVAKGQ